MQPFPSVIQDFIDGAKRIKEPWIQYLQQFTIAPPAFMDITLEPSPFEYTAKEPGNLYVSGGTITGITLTRGSDTINLTGEILIPVAVADVVEVSYSVLPTIKFIALYAVDTHNR